jgi:hypothetical protein
VLRSKYHFREKCGLKQNRGATAKRALPVNPARSLPHPLLPRLARGGHLTLVL